MYVIDRSKLKRNKLNCIIKAIRFNKIWLIIIKINPILRIEGKRELILQIIKIHLGNRMLYWGHENSLNLT